MPLDIVESATLASGALNEDRHGVCGNAAWVIDGATDVIAAPLTAMPSDAAWFAEALHQRLANGTLAATRDLRTLPARLAAELKPAFLAATQRLPDSRAEHPSAAGLIVRVDGQSLEFVALGDCTLLIEEKGSVVRIGTREEEAGDPWVVAALRKQAEAAVYATPAEARRALWPKLRKARAAMNTDGGYGIFSITAPPDHLIASGRMAAAPGAGLLIASDGLMRLVDVFRAYSTEGLFAAAMSRGLATLLAELRAIEREDADCLAFPRAKISDDATGVLARIV